MMRLFMVLLACIAFGAVFGGTVDCEAGACASYSYASYPGDVNESKSRYLISALYTENKDSGPTIWYECDEGTRTSSSCILNGWKARSFPSECTCVPCLAGFYCPDEDWVTRPIPCEKGYKAPYSAMRECIECENNDDCTRWGANDLDDDFSPEGNYYENETKSSLCNYGYYAIDPDADDVQCRIVELGYYSNNGATRRKCPNNMYTPAKGSAVCIPCEDDFDADTVRSSSDGSKCVSVWNPDAVSHEDSLLGQIYQHWLITLIILLLVIGIVTGGIVYGRYKNTHRTLQYETFEPLAPMPPKYVDDGTVAAAFDSNVQAESGRSNVRMGKKDRVEIVSGEGESYYYNSMNREPQNLGATNMRLDNEMNKVANPGLAAMAARIAQREIYGED